MKASDPAQPFSLGIPFMDASHESLMAELQRIAACPDDEFCQAYCDLIAVIESDFRGEEEAMEAIQFAGLQRHREQHARVLSAMHRCRPQVMAGDIAVGRKVIELFPQWFDIHIATLDHALARALEQAEGVGAK
jgi:hemerythrin-like metal-binding protein